MATGITSNYNLMDPLLDPRVMTFFIRTDVGYNYTDKGSVLRSPGLGEITPLPLLINPNSFSQTMEQQINRIKTIGGFVVQHWGHKPDVLKIVGKTPAFYLTPEEHVKALSLQPNAVNFYSNIQSTNSAYQKYLADVGRDLSESYREFRRLIDVYRHNGISTDPKTGQINKKALGKVDISYQGILYRGHFESFDYDEDENNPYTIEYSFTFYVLKEITLQTSLRAARG